MTLSNGSLWPIPITLDVDKMFRDKLKSGDKVSLVDREGFRIAVLQVGDIWKPDLKKEASMVYGTVDQKHPGVNYLLNNTNPYYVGGIISPVKLPNYYDFKEYRHTPTNLKKIFKKLKWDNVVAFQTRNPMHKACRNDKVVNGEIKCKTHPVTGLTKPGDVDYFTRVRCYVHG